ncbi:MAG TPA: hypothetical protein VK251_09515 [Steroidobacteraceae bacterium]|nr:hypothetical protein [Steroidobacteraceae bacterium]
MSASVQRSSVASICEGEPALLSRLMLRVASAARQEGWLLRRTSRVGEMVGGSLDDPKRQSFEALA